jgi:hypothetical protein
MKHFEALKKKHRVKRAGLPKDLSIRLHRALGWHERTEKETNDHGPYRL